MTKKELDHRLRQLNLMEIEAKEAHQIALKNYFSTQAKSDHWRINSEKLMAVNEDIAIHKHDRFLSFDKHNHDYIEMMFVYSGAITHHFENEVITLKKGEILLLDMDVEHSIEAAGEDDVAVNVLIRKEFFDTFFMQQIAYNDLISNFVIQAIYGKTNINKYIWFKTSTNPRLWELMSSILTEYYEQRHGMTTAIKAYMLLLFNELLREYQQYLSEHLVHKIDHSIAGEILCYIEEHYKTVTLTSISEVFSYSQDHMGKQIKKLTGHTLKSLIKGHKLEQAIYLLKHTQLPITEIAMEIGYSNMSYFYKQFREVYSQTPDLYRKQYNS